MPSDLTRLGWDAMTPLEANFTGVDPTVAQDLNPHHDSFLTIDNPNVVLIAWKLAEDGDGSIVRLEETAGQTEQIAVQPSHLRIVRARRCSLLEDCTVDVPVTDNALHLMVKPFEILTIRLNTTPKEQPGNFR